MNHSKFDKAAKRLILVIPAGRFLEKAPQKLLSIKKKYGNIIDIKKNSKLLRGLKNFFTKTSPR